MTLLLCFLQYTKKHHFEVRSGPRGNGSNQLEDERIETNEPPRNRRDYCCSILTSPSTFMSRFARDEFVQRQWHVGARQRLATRITDVVFNTCARPPAIRPPVVRLVSWLARRLLARQRKVMAIVVVTILLTASSKLKRRATDGPPTSRRPN